MYRTSRQIFQIFVIRVTLLALQDDVYIVDPVVHRRDVDVGIPNYQCNTA